MNTSVRVERAGEVPSNEAMTEASSTQPFPVRLVTTVAFVGFVAASFGLLIFDQTEGWYPEERLIVAAVSVIVSVGLTIGAYLKFPSLSQRWALGLILGGILAHWPIWAWIGQGVWNLELSWQIYALAEGVFFALPVAAIGIGVTALLRQKVFFRHGGGAVRAVSLGLTAGVYLSALCARVVWMLAFEYRIEPVEDFLIPLGLALLITLVVTLTVGLLLTPWFIAKHRESPQATAILVFSLLLGWFTIPWIIALVWAFASSPANALPQTVVVTAPNQNPTPVVTGGVAKEADSNNDIAALKQLGELRNEGIITDAEFEEKKAEILKRM
jgi:MFS family permease